MTTRRLPSTGLVLGTLVVAAVTVGCATSDDGSTDPTPTTSLPSPTVVEQVPDSGTGADSVTVPELLRFTSPLVGGGSLDAATTAGSPTLFWFWSPT